MYKLLKLPYSYQDLEPYIDTHTMGLHYHKHEQSYLDKLNKILKDNNYDYRYTLNELLYHINEFPSDAQEDILYNLGGILNHNLYWLSINPSQKQQPIGKLKMYLEKKYGSYEGFWKIFKETALKLKGSGYSALVLKNDGQLDIINMHNQETPLSLGYVPLLIIDLWEHAYYLNYKNEKSLYLDNFKEIASFSYANEVFNNIISDRAI